jgi:1,4-dihydroxy-6-naphthoate synthase
MSQPIRLGISTCPNDTFAFHALMAGEVDTEGLVFDTELLDVEELNRGFAAGDFDVAKMSFATMLRHASELVLLPAGSALGFGVGPVVLARAGLAREPELASLHVLSPGAGTTATLLWRLFHNEPHELDQRVFHAILPALVAGKADLGICIHEGRFSYAAAGLELFEDLGATWEEATGAPLPLGGIAARAELDADARAAVARAVRRSIEWSLARPGAAAATMARYAQDQSAEAHMKHVELYVNDWTVDLGERGRAALAALGELAAQRGLAPTGALEIQSS